MTRYSQQEGAARGYNPAKRGRSSHHPLMAFVSETRMVANLWLRPGNTSSANNIQGFLANTVCDKATWAEPATLATGIESVWVNGGLTVSGWGTHLDPLVP